VVFDSIGEDRTAHVTELEFEDNLRIQFLQFSANTLVTRVNVRHPFMTPTIREGCRRVPLPISAARLLYAARHLEREDHMTSLRPRAVTVASSAFLVAVGCVMGTASAVPVKAVASTHAVVAGSFPREGAGEGEGEESEKNGHYCDGCAPPLEYFGGAVMDSTSEAGVTITPIYWVPADVTQFPPDYPVIINGYISNVAAASGSTSNVYSVMSEYYAEAGGTTTNIAYRITAGTPVVDTQPFPDDGCEVLEGYDRCITDAQLRTELQRITAELGLPTDISHFYPVFFPPDVITQDLDGVSDSVSIYCGYHRAFGSGDHMIVYGNEPYEEDGCDSGQAPNGNLIADGAVSVLSHEIIEAVTDPTDSPAWIDGVGYEIADICTNDYGEALGSTDPANPSRTQYNQLINGGTYYTQTEFSNKAFDTLGMGGGCIQNEDALGNLVPEVRTAVGSVFTAAYPNALEADGATTAEIDTLVTNRADEVIEGDVVNFSTYVVSGEGQCGTLSTESETTGSDGYAIITYTASTDDVVCAIVGTDTQGGQASSGTVYQGSTQQLAPAAADTFPTEVVADGSPTTFTTTFTNPTDKPIFSAQVTLAIFPGEGATENISAEQLALEYSTSGEDGPFTNVELVGSTIEDGAIQGTIGDPRDMSVPGGVDVGHALTITFRLTLDETVPTDDVQPLIAFEAYLDRINQGSGAGTNLADTGARDALITSSASTTSASGPESSAPDTASSTAVTEATETIETADASATTDSIADETTAATDATDETDETDEIDETDETRRPRRSTDESDSSESSSSNTVVYVLLSIGAFVILVVLLVQQRGRRRTR